MSTRRADSKSMSLSVLILIGAFGVLAVFVGSSNVGAYVIGIAILGIVLWRLLFSIGGGF